MLADLQSLFPQISLLQHPLAFLDSYVWGCARGIQLCFKGRQNLLSRPGSRGGAQDDLETNLAAVLSILECYAHSQVCTYCVPAHLSGTATPSAASALLPAADATCEHAQLKQSLAGISDPAVARAALRSHQDSCTICRAKEQRARAGAPIWTMEAARLHHRSI